MRILPAFFTLPDGRFSFLHIFCDILSQSPLLCNYPFRHNIIFRKKPAEDYDHVPRLFAKTGRCLTSTSLFWYSVYFLSAPALPKYISSQTAESSVTDSTAMPLTSRSTVALPSGVAGSQLKYPHTSKISQRTEFHSLAFTVSSGMASAAGIKPLFDQFLSRSVEICLILLLDPIRAPAAGEVELHGVGIEHIILTVARRRLRDRFRGCFGSILCLRHNRRFGGRFCHRFRSGFRFDGGFLCSLCGSVSSQNLRFRRNIPATCQLGKGENGQQHNQHPWQNLFSHTEFRSFLTVLPVRSIAVITVCGFLCLLFYHEICKYQYCTHPVRFQKCGKRSPVSNKADNILS